MERDLSLGLDRPVFVIDPETGHWIRLAVRTGQLGRHA
jgi:hypothetical protein